MKKYLKRILVCILMIGCVNKPVNAQMIEKDEMVIKVEVSDGSIIERKIPVDESAMLSTQSVQEDPKVTKTGTAYIMFNEETTDVKVLTQQEYLNEVKATRGNSTTDTSSSSNVFWKATVSITYKADDTYCTFIKAGASWTQLRGSTTLTDREVYWGGTLGITAKGQTYHPNKNDVSYDINWGPEKYGHGSIIGCNSSATYKATNGSLSGKITANVSHDFV